MESVWQSYLLGRKDKVIISVIGNLSLFIQSEGSFTLKSR